MAEIPVERKTRARVWPWLLGLIVLVGLGMLVWAGSNAREVLADADGAQDGAQGEAVAAVDRSGEGNTTVGIAESNRAGLVVATGQPVGADGATVMIFDAVAGDETAAEAKRDAAITAATMAAEREPLKLIGRRFLMEDAVVTEVTSDGVFWVSPRGSRVTFLAVLNEPKAADDRSERPYLIEAGTGLTVLGVIERLDAGGGQPRPLTADAIARAGGDNAVYLNVYRVDLSGPAGVTTSAERFEADRLVVQEHVFFGYDSAELSPSGRTALNGIAAELKSSGPEWQRLRVEGHADKRGPKAYNQSLSRDRAQAVAGYLAKVGVDDDKLDIKAYGESRPLEIDASTPEAYQQNRRVAFTIVRAP